MSRQFGLHIRNKRWIPDSWRYPNKCPNQPLNVPRYLSPQAHVVGKYVPKDLVPIIFNFAYNIGPMARVAASIVHDYNVADRFYGAIMYGGLKVSDQLLWLPMPYYHPLRERAISKFIDFSDVPWTDQH